MTGCDSTVSDMHWVTNGVMAGATDQELGRLRGHRLLAGRGVDVAGDRFVSEEFVRRGC